MAAMHCALCDRPVEARRRIGAGTVFFAVITAGVSLLAVPFYRKRCPICGSTALSYGRLGIGPGTASGGHVAELEGRLGALEGELERSQAELERVRTERDFYRQLLGDPPGDIDRPGR
ncbi:MAG: hypothetical protein WEB88_06390 [Gemmatimonadota bacterium]